MFSGRNIQRFIGMGLVFGGLLGFTNSLLGEDGKKYMLELPASPDAAPMEEGHLGYFAAGVLVTALNKLLLENDRSQEAFAANFGLEPEGILGHLKESGRSEFLTHLFSTLKSRQESSDRVELKIMDKKQCWLLSQDGNYRQYACAVEIQGSEYKRGMLLFRLEILDSDSAHFSVSAKPSLLYVALL